MANALLVILLVVAGVLIVLALVVVYGVSRLRRAQRRHRHLVDALEPVRSTTANFFGQASAGRTQVRGLGTLALSADELVFVQLVTDREVRVPRAAVTSTSTTLHFLGKTTGRPLLVVTWDHLGATDAVAFDVPDVEAWQAELRP